MFRLSIVFAAAGALLLVPEIQTADACGVKMSVKGARVRQARASLETRRASGTREQRAPKAVGPIATSARTPMSTGGGEAGGTGAGPVKVARAPKARQEKPKQVEKTPEKAPEEVKVAKRPEKKPEKKPASEPMPASEPVAVNEPATDGGAGNVKLHKEYSFENGSAVIGAEQREHLLATAAWMKANPKKRLVVQGHANRVGSADTNMAISQARAAAVVDFLVAEGVPAKRLSQKGFGSTKPAYKPANDPRNRRVVLTVK